MISVLSLLLWYSLHYHLVQLIVTHSPKISPKSRGHFAAHCTLPCTVQLVEHYVPHVSVVKMNINWIQMTTPLRHGLRQGQLVGWPTSITQYNARRREIISETTDTTYHKKTSDVRSSTTHSKIREIINAGCHEERDNKCQKQRSLLGRYSMKFDRW